MTKIQLILCGSALLLSTSLYAQKPAGGQQTPPPPAVLIGKVVPVTEKAQRQYIGIVEAINSVEIPVRVTGFLKTIKFDDGAHVQKDDLLFKIEDSIYLAQMRAAQAARDIILPELKFALQNYNRQKTLLAKNVVAESVVEEAEQNLMLAKAKLEQAEALLAEAKTTLSYCEMYAPLSGKIGRVAYTEGAYLTPTSAPIVNIIQTDPIYIKFSLSERDYLNMFKKATKGDKLANNIQVDIKLANGKKLDTKGTLAFVDNKVQRETASVTIWAAFSNQNEQLTPNGFVTVSLREKNTTPVLGVKVTAIMTDKNGSYVYVVKEGNKVERRNVILGDIVNGIQTVIQGLESEDRVIVDGAHKTHEGGTINPVEATE